MDVGCVGWVGEDGAPAGEGAGGLDGGCGDFEGCLEGGLVDEVAMGG